MEYNTQHETKRSETAEEAYGQFELLVEQRIHLHIERKLKHLEERIMTVEELTTRLEADATAYTSDLETVKTISESNTAEISTLRTELAAIKAGGDTTRAEAALATIEGNNKGLSALGTPVAPVPPVVPAPPTVPAAPTF